MNSIFKSIRWRLQVWHGLILLIVLTSFCITAYLLVRDNRVRRVDQRLQQHASALLDAMRPMEPIPGGPPPELQRPRGPGQDRPGPRGRRFGGDRPDPDGPGFRMLTPEHLGTALALLGEKIAADGMHFTVWGPDGTLLERSANAPESIPFPSEVLTETTPTLRTREGSREIVVANRRGFRVIVAQDMAPELAEVRLLAWRLGMTGLGVLLLGLACGWWMATRAIQPIAEISSTARKIAAGNLDERINVTGTDNEFSQLAQVLNTTFGRLQAAFARQAEFTADASHELRTPVSVVLSQTQMTLAKDRTPGEYRECIEACQRAAQRMRQLVESLLVLARLDSGEADAPREHCDLKRITSDSLDLLRPIATARQIALELDLLPAACLGDPGQLGQVATNLVSNAIHYNRPAGTVHVSVTTENQIVRLTVRDNGIGIAANDLPHIFDRFYRADKSRSRSAGHAGLGLAIAKAIVETHRGTLEVESELGRGSTFTVRLPRQAG